MLRVFRSLPSHAHHLYVARETVDRFNQNLGSKRSGFREVRNKLVVPPSGNYQDRSPSRFVEEFLNPHSKKPSPVAITISSPTKPTQETLSHSVPCLLSRRGVVRIRV